MSEEVHIHLHIDGLDGLLAALLDRRFHQILSNSERLLEMGTSLSAQLDAATASIKADVANVSTEVTSLLAGLTPGSTITQAQVDALTGIDTALKAIPAAPSTGTTHTPQDTTDTTLNGVAKANGTIRNNFFLPNFNPALPETS
jgi:hypothetical protein